MKKAYMEGLKKTAADFSDMKFDYSDLAAAHTTGMEKRPGFMASAGGPKAMALGLFGGGLALNAIFTKLKNDTRRTALIEDLMMTDMVIKSADKGEVLSYYATIYKVAPQVSLDKNAVRELLHNFIKFGRVDIASMKTLAEVESKMQGNHSIAPNFKLSDFIPL